MALLDSLLSSSPPPRTPAERELLQVLVENESPLSAELMAVPSNRRALAALRVCVLRAAADALQRDIVRSKLPADDERLREMLKQREAITKGIIFWSGPVA